MTWVAGIDPSSTVVGWVVLSDDPTCGDGGTFNLGAAAYTPAKAARAYMELQRILGKLPAGTRVFIEAPLVGRGGARATLVQAYISGALQSATQHLGLPCLLVNVQTWKKEVGGRGNAPKDVVAERIRDLWTDSYPGLAAIPGIPEGTTGSDLYDAAGLAVYGLRTVRRRIRLA